MSKSQLQTNNAKLEALITELQGKAAGGGSGGSVETCTVYVNDCRDVFYTSVEGGAIVSKSSIQSSTTSDHTIQAVKNSVIFCGRSASSSGFSGNGAELIASYSSYYSAWKITTDGAVIRLSSSGGAGGGSG